MSQFVTCRALADAAQQCGGPEMIRKRLAETRQAYLATALPPRLKRALAKVGVDTSSEESGAVDVAPVLREQFGFDWGNWEHHLRFRLHLNRNSSRGDFEIARAILNLGPESVENLTRVVKTGVLASAGDSTEAEHRYYDLSVLPLNLILGEEVLRNFLPPADYFESHATKVADPYGLIHGRSRSKQASGQHAVIVDGVSKEILGTHKFSNTFLFNVDLYCPIGCADCYKTRMGTRETSVWNTGATGCAPKIYQHLEMGNLVPPRPGQWAERAEKAVEWMNGTDRGRQVYDVILSGGEPLLALSNESLREILRRFERAENVRLLRICTGGLFLGLASRLDDELLDVLSDFADRSGMRITFQAHLGSPEMITPEAALAADRLRRRGFSAYSQVPIKNGVNFFLGDFEKTLSTLVELGRRQVAVGVEPYMFIVDMHPSTNAFYVPIEPLMWVWAELVESHDHPGLERPRTLSVLFDKGNIVLSGHALFAARKSIDRSAGCVTYDIPRADLSPKVGIEVYTYTEPLLEGINDDPSSLTKLQGQWKRKLKSQCRRYGKKQGKGDTASDVP